MTSELMLSEEQSDVILKVRHEGYSWRMPAHSLLLVNKSSVFQEMLDERSGNTQPISIPLIGVIPETAVDVLNHIYRGEFPADVTTDLLIASQRFNLLSLRENLEERLISDMTLIQACSMFDELHQKLPHGIDYVKTICQKMIEAHALTVFGSDMVLLFSKLPLIELLKSNELNVPDESHLFWGVWRWCRRHSSKTDRYLTDESVASYNDDLMVLIRCNGLRNGNCIPSIAASRFSKCLCCRTAYSCPPDILKHTSPLRPCPTWEDILSAKMSKESEVLCAQLSVTKDVLLVGVTLEACVNEENNLSMLSKLDSILRVIRESDSAEVWRQKVGWCLTALRKISVKGDPESRLECDLIFKEPLFLTTGQFYSIYLNGNLSTISFLWSSAQKKQFRIGNTFVNFHGEGVSTIRELYFVPDMSISWGKRVLDI